MDRREFMTTGFTAGTAMALGMQSAIAQGRKSNRAKFRMKYAPHFGMFRNSAGNDLIDQLKFAADQGFFAWEDNGMMRKPVELQKKIAKTMKQLEMTMGVFVSSGGFDKGEFTTSTSKDLHDRLHAQMKKAVEVAKRVNATWSTFVPGNISLKLEHDYQMANCIENLKVCAGICEPAGLVRLSFVYYEKQMPRQDQEIPVSIAETSAFAQVLRDHIT